MRATLINTVLPALQTAIGNDIIKPIIKRTSEGSRSTTIVASTDSVWLLSEYEIFGRLRNAAPGEQPLGIDTCYPAFPDAASRIKKIGTSNDNWLERSPTANISTGFEYVTNFGEPQGASATALRGVSIGFCI